MYDDFFEEEIRKDFRFMRFCLSTLAFGSGILLAGSLRYGGQTERDKKITPLEKMVMENCENNHVYVVSGSNEDCDPLYVIPANGEVYRIEKEQITDILDISKGYVQLEADLNGDGKADFSMIVDDEFTKVDSNTLENLGNSYTRKRTE